MTIMQIGLSAVLTAEQQIATVGHNMANQKTPGYNRQVVHQASAGAQSQGNGFIGMGTEVVDVTRVYDDFLNKQLLAVQTSASAFSAYSGQMDPLDDGIVDNPSLGISDFFRDVNSFVDSPGKTVLRDGMLHSSQMLVERFNSLGARLRDSSDSINSEVRSSVDLMNNYATQIASMNESIVSATIATGHSPNDLLDKRDQLVASLNTICKVTISPASNGRIDVMIGNHQPLVMGNKTSKVVAFPSNDDPSRLGLGVQYYNTTTSLNDTDFFSGGRLGGLLRCRSETLDPAQKKLGKIAVVLAANINDQNKLGLDANDQLGGDIFIIPPPKVIGRSTNSTSATLTAGVTDGTKVLDSDYRMSYDGTDYTLTRLSDGEETVIPMATYPSEPPPEIDGVTYPQPTMAAGDVFTIRPTIDAALSLSVLMASADGIAAAAPISTAFNTDNTGTGTISAGSVDKNFLSSTVILPLTATFSTTTPPAQPTTFVLADGATPPNIINEGVAINGVAVTGSLIHYAPDDTVTYQGMSFVMRGAPGSGDSFTISANTDAPKDSRNLQLIAGLENKHDVINGTSLRDACYSLSGFVANKTNEVHGQRVSHQLLVNALTDQQQSESGVNMSEEEQNLQQYEDFFKAGSEVIKTANNMLDVILRLF